MKLDPTKMKDWQVAEAAEANLKPAAELLKDLGIKDDEWDAYGKYLAKVDVTRVLRRLEKEGIQVPRLMNQNRTT